MDRRVRESLNFTRKVEKEAIPKFRPILIIPVVAKVFKHIVYDQLYHYLNENKLLCCYPSGFSTLHATVTAMIKATDIWSLNVERSFFRCTCLFRL